MKKFHAIKTCIRSIFAVTSRSPHNSVSTASISRSEMREVTTILYSSTFRSGKVGAQKFSIFAGFAQKSHNLIHLLSLPSLQNEIWTQWKSSCPACEKSPQMYIVIYSSVSQPSQDSNGNLIRNKLQNAPQIFTPFHKTCVATKYQRSIPGSKSTTCWQRSLWHTPLLNTATTFSQPLHQIIHCKLPMAKILRTSNIRIPRRATKLYIIDILNYHIGSSKLLDRNGRNIKLEASEMNLRRAPQSW